MNPPETFGGIDVSKATLEVAVRPTASSVTVANDEPGLAADVTQVQPLRPTLIVVEATGGYNCPWCAPWWTPRCP